MTKNHYIFINIEYVVFFTLFIACNKFTLNFNVTLKKGRIFICVGKRFQVVTPILFCLFVTIEFTFPNIYHSSCFNNNNKMVLYIFDDNFIM